MQPPPPPPPPPRTELENKDALTSDCGVQWICICFCLSFFQIHSLSSVRSPRTGVPFLERSVCQLRNPPPPPYLCASNVGAHKPCGNPDPTGEPHLS